MEFLLETQPGHEAWREFFYELSDAGSVIVLNRLLEAELYNSLFRVILRERWGRQAANKRFDGRVRNRVARLFEEARDRAEEFLDAIDHLFVELDEVIDEIPSLMCEYGVGSYDAVHIATAMYSEVPLIATRDRGFAYIPEQSLKIVTEHRRALVMREIRAKTKSRY